MLIDTGDIDADCRSEFFKKFEITETLVSGVKLNMLDKKEKTQNFVILVYALSNSQLLKMKIY